MAILLSIDDINFMFKVHSSYYSEIPFCFEETGEGLFTLVKSYVDLSSPFQSRTRCDGSLMMHTHPNNYYGFSEGDYSYLEDNSNRWAFIGIVTSDKLLVSDINRDYWVLS